MIKGYGSPLSFSSIGLPEGARVFLTANELEDSSQGQIDRPTPRQHNVRIIPSFIEEGDRYGRGASTETDIGLCRSLLPGAEEDLKWFARRTGHEIIQFEEKEGILRFFIRKRG